MANRASHNLVRPFTHNVMWVTAGHFAAIVILFLFSLVPSLFRPKHVAITPIDFVVNPETEVGEESAPEPEQVAPAPPPKPKANPEDTIPEPKATPKPKPAPEKPPEAKPKPKIKVSTMKVKKPGTPKPLTAQEIRDRLALGARIGTYNSAIPSDEGLNLNRIQQKLYSAWIQPSSDSAGKPTATARIRLDRQGRIVDRRLERPSGIAEFDKSVLQALNAVDRIDGLTVSFLERYSTGVTVLFELE